MTERAWQDMIVGDRMQVDQEFAGRLQASRFSRQEWGLIMSAVELKIEGSGENARLVADTSQVEGILPELERIKKDMQAMGGAEPGGGGSGGSGSEGGGGFLSALKSSLGFGGSRSNRAALEEAETLADDYAAALQAHLEENGKWQLVRGRSD